ncbi:MAG: nuclear transport factor 2 family protein [Sphingomonas bacterium]|uniref:nuclear transport factor 2 family protein n=1 Tax=Sphingomonas bacterium TaxID=1895847 RepID=UPI002618CA7D|nr:nuclear transport factor 2 family protein [Sphingomonas bacterium]MDB5704996.1 nuclear transport factor 2 family protein [Sphingomonas bacterium]
MDEGAAKAFASEWIEAWNLRDLDRVLSPYADDVVFNSPVAARVMGDGVVRGKTDLRSYWSKALPLRPALRFTLLETFGGHESVAVRYRDELGNEVIETFIFDADGKVAVSTACKSLTAGVSS